MGYTDNYDEREYQEDFLEVDDRFDDDAIIREVEQYEDQEGEGNGILQHLSRVWSASRPGRRM